MTDVYNNYGQVPPDVSVSSPLSVVQTPVLQEPSNFQVNLPGARRNGSLDAGKPFQREAIPYIQVVPLRQSPGSDQSQFRKDDSQHCSKTLDTRLLQRALDPRTLDTSFLDTRTVDSRTLDSREDITRKECTQRLLSNSLEIEDSCVTLDRHGYDTSSQFQRLSHQDLSQLTLTQTNSQTHTPETMVPLHSLTDLGTAFYQDSAHTLNSLPHHPNGSARPYGMPSSGSNNRLTQRSSSCRSFDVMERSTSICCSSCGCCKVFVSLLMCLAIFGAVVVALYFFIRYAPYQSRPISEDGARDPCSLHPCQHGAICVPVGDDNRPQCRCPDNCDAMGLSSEATEEGGEIFCVSDGQDYETECQMKLEACRQQKELTVKYSGTCDPCRYLKCPASQVCRVAADRKPRCDCEDSCTTEFDPICASDGKTYANVCHMKVEGCRNQRNLDIIYRGACDIGLNPCDAVSCLLGEMCKIDNFGIARCECPPRCEPVVIPVCGSDGVTYDSHCELRRRACIKQLDITVLFVGLCGSRGVCSGFQCQYGAVCVERHGRPVCECPPCPGQLNPVCGDDGLSYNNECLLRAEACARQRDIAVEYRGRCSGCEDKQCPYNGVCEAEDGIGSCVCPNACVNVESPICASDGRTYVNECHMKVAACRQQRDIKVASRGDCDLCKHVECKYGARCEAGQCLCPTSCPDTREPVCGSNGATYLNECMMQRMACQLGQPALRVAFFGECSEARSSGVRMQQGATFGKPVESISRKGITTLEGTIVFPPVQLPPHILDVPPTHPPDPCLIMNCEFGSNCVILDDGLPRCSCTINCTEEKHNSEPVCASDLKMYPSECTMNREACQRQVELRLRPLELCEDYELIPCDSAAPMVNPITGRDFYCGEGPDKEECPSNSYCHWSLSFAKCCPLDNGTSDDYPMETGCRASEFLCCPDGITDAKGDNFAGCPSICQCHKLGAYEDTCDPVTNQCKCKPGVGGTKCDRCEPGFWGLPMIQRGSDGCLPCGCSLFGSVRDDCEQMTGQCVCKPGIGGKKCNMCPDGLVLGPKGCQPESAHATPAPGSCDELQCYFGARCHQQGNRVECVCDAQCPADSSNVTPVCGSDGETYGSECHLKLFACRYQKDVVVETLGPCNLPAALSTEPHREDATKSTRHLLPEFVLGADDKIGNKYKSRTRNGQDANYVLSSNYDYERRFDETVLGERIGQLSQRTHELFSNIQGKIKENKSENVSDRQDRLSSNSGRRVSLFNSFVTPSLSNSVLYPTPVSYAVSRLIDSVCIRDNDCSVPYSQCRAGFCNCRKGYTQSSSLHTCVANSPGHEAATVNPCVRSPCHGGGSCKPRLGGGFTCTCTTDRTGPLCEKHTKPSYHTPAFEGTSYLEIKKIKAYNKVQIEMEFRTFSSTGLLLYSQQHENGMGDFLSLAVIDGFVEFRYNLGSGTAVIRSHHKITPKRFHKVVAKRYQKDGMLQLDSAEDAIGKAPGHLKSLDLRGSTYLGFVPGAPRRVWDNVGTSDGFVGCIRSVRINGRPVDLVWPSSTHIIQASHVSDCVSNPCYNMPCLNRGSCRPADNTGYKCICIEGYTGDRCEVRVDPCSGMPCMGGGTCVALPDKGFMCQCPPGRSGHLCDMVEQSLREVVVPEFDGDSYLELPTLEGIGTSFAIEVWFLARSGDGVLLYNGQGSGGGDFVAINLKNGHLEFLYNLGSGHTKLSSPEPVELDVWHVARVRRKKRRGSLRLDRGRRVTGKSGSKMVQLNLDQNLFLGGMTNFTQAHPDSGVVSGLSGAIQRVLVNKEVMDDLPNRATGGKAVKRYRGPPCYPNLCQGEGVCQPYLNRFVCKCPAGLQGKFCEKGADQKIPAKPVSFSGHNFLQFNNIVKNISQRLRVSSHFQVKFLTTATDGLLLWSGATVGDYIALAVVAGNIQLTYRLGGQDEAVFIRSKVTVSDGEWHEVIAYRRRRLAVLRVDRERPVKGVAEKGNASLDTDDKIFIGGAPHLPQGLPASYYKGFQGCIDELQVQNRGLDLFSHDGTHQVNFCDNMR